MALLVAVDGLLKDEKGEDDGKGGVEPSDSAWRHGEHGGDGDVVSSIGGEGREGGGDDARGKRQ